ncbi:copia protein [Tanacetum coccineum]
MDETSPPPKTSPLEDDELVEEEAFESAFLNDFINEEVYVAQPLGFIDFAKPNDVYRLKKALYGLKQALKAWVFASLWDVALTSWFSKKQTALAIFTTEAEYVSAGKACQQAIWMKQALVDYGVRLDDIPIMCDNKGAIDLRNISLEKVSSEDNIADILTKPLNREPFNYLRLGLGMMEQID